MACTLGIFYYLKLMFKVAVRICAGPFFFFFLWRIRPSLFGFSLCPASTLWQSLLEDYVGGILQLLLTACYSFSSSILLKFSLNLNDLLFVPAQTPQTGWSDFQTSSPAGAL
jgi:hypothetical protein